MKNNKELLTLEELINIGNVNNLDSNMVQTCIKQCKEYNAILGKNFVVPMFSMYGDNLDIVHSCECLIANEKVNKGMYLKLNFFSKKYYVHYYNNFRYCDSSEKDRVLKSSGMIEPNNIGVLTLKKVEKEIEYLYSLHLLYVDRDAKNKEKIEKFLDDINMKFESCLHSYPVPENKIIWGKDKLSGYIYRNGFEYSFSINNGSGNINESIKLRAINNNVNTFIALSNNDYKEEVRK